MLTKLSTGNYYDTFMEALQKSFLGLKFSLKVERSFDNFIGSRDEMQLS